MPEVVSTSDTPELTTHTCDETLNLYHIDNFDVGDLNDRVDSLELSPNLIESPPEVLTNFDPMTDSKPPSSFDVIILDGMAVLHILDPRGSSTFQEFLDNVFCPISFTSYRQPNDLTYGS